MPKFSRLLHKIRRRLLSLGSDLQSKTRLSQRSVLKMCSRLLPRVVPSRSEGATLSGLKQYSPLLLIPLIALSVYFVLRIIAIPRAPVLRSGTGDSLYSASNNIYTASIGTKDGGSDVSFSVGESGSSFILAGAAKVKGVKKGKSVTFPGVNPGVDLRYTTTPNGLKEEIILSKDAKESTKNIFLFDLALTGVTPKKLTNDFIDPTFHDAAGKYQFHFEKPFAVDANGSRTNAVLLQIMEDKQVMGNYSMKLIVDEQWLSDADRVYPIVIDPTIVHDTTTEFAAGYFDRIKDIGSGSAPFLETYYQELPTDQRTVGLWHLNEASGNALDSSGNSNTGSPTGTTITTGILGNARSFNGTSDYITVSNSASLGIGGTFSVEAWVKPSSLSARYVVFSTRKNAAAGGWQLEVGTGNAGTARVSVTGVGTWIFDSVSGVINSNVWSHVAYVRTSNSDVGQIYVNGIAVSATTTTVYTILDNTDDKLIGAATTTAQFFPGSIDEVRLSNIALSAEQIKADASRRPSAIYTSPTLDLGGIGGYVTTWNPFTWTELGVATGDGETLKDATGLVAQWNLNSTSGTTATNDAGSCGATCNGTLTGFASTASQDQAAGTGWTTANRRWGAGALMFDGTNDFVDLGNNLDPGTGDYSVEFWMQTSQSTAWRTIQKRGTGALASVSGFQVAGTAGYFTNTYFTDGVGNSSGPFSGDYKINDGKWHHVSVTWENATGNLLLYIDGGFKEIAPKVGTPAGKNYTSTRNLSFGAAWDAAGTQSQFLAGAIDSSRIYSRVLTASEILSNYQSGNVDLQTRVGTSTNPDDGTWEEWKSATGETQVDTFDTNSSATGVYTLKVADLSTNQTWAKKNNTTPTTSDTTGTDGRLPIGNTGRGDSNGAFGESVIKDGSTYKMWYQGSDATNWRAYYASSSDGLTWTKYDNTVPAASDTTSTNGRIPLGTAGKGDSSGIQYPTIIKDGSTYKMWYQGLDGTNNRIYYATSPDGLTWTKYDNTTPTASDTTSTNGRIPLGTAGKGDVNAVGQPTVIKDGSTYKMWYAGHDGTNWRIYYATSPDGLTWTKYDNTIPVISDKSSTNGRIPLGNTGTADYSHAYVPTVIKDGDTYKMWYTALMGSARIGYATSFDGITWTKYNNAVEAISDTTGTDGRLPLGNTGTGDQTHALGPTVIKENGVYHMWYSGHNGSYWMGYYATMTPTPISESLESNIKIEGASSEKFTFGQSQVDSNLVGLWHLDETGGTGGYLQDATGNGNHATPNSTTVANGVSGKAHNFNGTSSVISVPANTAFDFAGDYTLEAWIKPTTSGVLQGILGKNSVNGWGLNLNSTNKINFGMHSCSNFDGATTIYPNQWYHVVGIYQSTGSKIYVNGVLDSTGTLTLGNCGADTSNIVFGQYRNTSANNFYGIIDEVRISKSARTAEEIAESYRLGRDHYVNKTIASTDLSGKTSLPFYVAADRPGSYLSTIIGESPFVSYQPDANTIGLWHLDDSQTFLATGGTVTYSGGYTIHTFTSDGTFTPNGPGIVETLVVAGGGGGANTGSGGGAGGYVSNTSFPVTQNNYAITVGSGGLGGITPGPGIKGNNSIFSTITAEGGGAGISHGGCAGGNGGSGSGGPISTTCTATGGTASQGSAGGAGYLQASWIGTSGGGGGAGAIGTAGGNTAGVGKGGDGLSNSISGAAVTYAGGGGGGEVSGSFVGAGGTGGGGAAVVDGVGGAGTANTGGGGAGGSYNAGVYNNGGNGGSGIVIIRYLTSTKYVKDATGNANGGAVVGAAMSQGKIGKARLFNGTSDFINIGTSTSYNLSTYTISGWFKTSDSSDYKTIICKEISSANRTFSLFLWKTGAGTNVDGSLMFGTSSGGVGSVSAVTPFAVNDNNWHHFAAVLNGTTDARLYVDGKLAVVDSSVAAPDQPSVAAIIGNNPTAGRFWGGLLDEIRIDNTIRTADEVRQAYEVGLRSHPITIDFGASLDSDDLITNSGDQSFTVDATTFGLNQPGSMLFPGDKIIVKENYNSTEYIAQGVVTSVVESSGAVTIATWDTGSTFPIAGYTVNASVFKWQREYWRVDGEVQDSSLDAITNLTLRLTDGSEGRTIYLDDLRSTSGYLTHPLGSTITSTTGSRYFQYRTILSSVDEAVSPQISTVNLDYVLNDSPIAPTLTTPLDLSTNQSTTPTLITVSTDPDSDYLRYKIELCTNALMTIGCQTFDQTSSQTGWTGQDAQTSTAYTSGTPASYTLQTPLTMNTHYYWRSYAIDPAGINLWSATQTPFSFATGTSPTLPVLGLPSNGVTNQSLTPALHTTATDSDSDYLRYKIELCTDLAMTTDCQTFDQTSSQTGWTGQDAETGTAYASGTQAIYTLTANLAPFTQYFWRTSAIDPGGFNTWSTTSLVSNFTTRKLNEGFTCLLHETPDDSSLTITWTDNESIEDSYKLERSVDGASFTSFQTLPADTTSYLDTSIIGGHTYQYRLAPFMTTGSYYGDWCTTATLNFQKASFNFSGLNFSGLNFN